MAGELTIRRYRPGDADRVWELHEEALRDVNTFFDGGDGAINSDVRSVEEEYLDSGGEFLVGLSGDRIVAMGAFREPGELAREFLGPLGESVAEIKRVRVDPDEQRQGYGQLIYDELEKRARDRGYAELVLDTTDRQRGAKRFFEKNGFEEACRERIREFREPFELVFYRKSLAE